MKIKLLIVSDDDSYTNHLSRVLVEKHGDVFEVSICSREERLQEMLTAHRFDVALIESTLAVRSNLQGIQLPLILWCDTEAFEAEIGDYPNIRKYQRISYIVRDILEQYAAISSKSAVFGSSQAHVTVVWSPAGGSGKTTAALAYAAQRVATGKKTVYLDLQNFSCSSVYFQQSGKSISALFEKMDGNIELLVQSIRQQDGESGIYYFCQPENYDDINILTTEDLLDLIDGCSKGVDELVIDLSSVCDEKTRELLKLSNTVLLVLDASRNAKVKWEQFCTQHNIYEQIRSKIVLVANRGAQAESVEGAGIVYFPYVQSANPVVVYKTLSVNFPQ